jgi:Protein of unknown function (DUF2917)
MKIQLTQSEIRLGKKQLLTVTGGKGQPVVCRKGSIWITQDGDVRDVVLREGESFTLDRAGPAIVQSFEPAAFCLGKPARRARRERAGGLAERLHAWFETSRATGVWA